MQQMILMVRLCKSLLILILLAAFFLFLSSSFAVVVDDGKTRSCSACTIKKSFSSVFPLCLFVFFFFFFFFLLSLHACSVTLTREQDEAYASGSCVRRSLFSRRVYQSVWRRERKKEIKKKYFLVSFDLRSKFSPSNNSFQYHQTNKLIDFILFFMIFSFVVAKTIQDRRFHFSTVRIDGKILFFLPRIRTVTKTKKKNYQTGMIHQNYQRTRE